MTESEEERRKARMIELEQVCGVNNEILRVHGVAPGSKPDGVWRLIYENLNGIQSRLIDNDKLDKAKSIIDDMEADIVCYNEHRLNLMHKDNKNGFSQMFNGGDAEIRSVAAHNTHEGRAVGKVQEGGTAMLLFGGTIDQYDYEASGKDETGLGRWVSMVLVGENGMVTRIVTCYNPCYNKTQGSRTSYQQQRRYFLTVEKDDTCPRKRFIDDLSKQLEKWQEAGERLIVCMDANEHIYKKKIGDRSYVDGPIWPRSEGSGRRVHWRETRSNILQRQQANRCSMGFAGYYGSGGMCDASRLRCRRSQTLPNRFQTGVYCGFGATKDCTSSGEEIKHQDTRSSGEIQQGARAAVCQTQSQLEAGGSRRSNGAKGSGERESG
jgi:exonuclease III